MPSCRAASTLAWPAIRPPSSPTSAGVVQPHSLMLAAIAATWASVWIRAFLAYGISRSIAHRSTLSARHQATVLAHARPRRPAPLLHDRGDRGDLGIRVGPCIFGIRDQPVDRPPLDLVRRPRPLISGRLSRAGARAPRRGKCWRFFAPPDPLQAALRLAPLIIPLV